MRRQISQYIFSFALFFACLFLGGCTGVSFKSSGNAEGFAGAKPLPGTYYAVHSNVACPDSALSGHQAVIEISPQGKASYRGACDTTAVDLPASALIASLFGHDSFAGSGMLVSGDLIYDAKSSVPTAASAGPSTRAWLSQKLGSLYYDVIIGGAVGPVEAPSGAKAYLFITERPAGGKKSFRLALELSVTGATPDVNRQIFAGENFALTIKRSDRRATGVLTLTLEGKSTELTALTGYATYFAPPEPGLTRPVIQLTAGDQHSCGSFNGSAYCWGSNNSGQGGVTGMASNVPRAIPSLDSGVTHISAGGSHACAVKSGKAYCWGDDQNGQIGRGGTGVGSTQHSPFEVVGSRTNASSIAAGNLHTCGIFGGKAFCWGNNSNLQLGTGEATSGANAPTAVITITEELQSISTALWHSCALTVGGEAYCWGDNTNGQLGRGTTGGMSGTPQKIPGVRFVSLFAGGHGTCGLTVQGKVACWGSNLQAEASGTGIASQGFSAPTEVAPVPGPVSSIAVGRGFVCALQSGQPICWGGNQSGQLGQGITEPASPARNVEGLSGVIGLAAGYIHTLAYSLASAFAWGDNAAGQLGDGTNQERRFATPFDFP